MNADSYVIKGPEPLWLQSVTQNTFFHNYAHLDVLSITVQTWESRNNITMIIIRVFQKGAWLLLLPDTTEILDFILTSTGVDAASRASKSLMLWTLFIVWWFVNIVNLATFLLVIGYYYWWHFTVRFILLTLVNAFVIMYYDVLQNVLI